MMLSGGGERRRKVSTRTRLSSTHGPSSWTSESEPASPVVSSSLRCELQPDGEPGRGHHDSVPGSTLAAGRTEGGERRSGRRAVSRPEVRHRRPATGFGETACDRVSRWNEVVSAVQEGQ